MKKVLIIEDQSPHLTDMKAEFSRFGDFFEVFPEHDNDMEYSLNNKGHLIDTLLGAAGNSKFEEVTQFYQDIDLFIIDVTLYASRNDRTGVDFLNFLQRSNYRFRKFNFIIISQHNLENIGTIEAEFSTNRQYVSKNTWGTLFPKEVVAKAIDLLKLSPTITTEHTPGHAEPNGGEQSYVAARRTIWDNQLWINLPDTIEKNIIHRFNLLIFYIAIFATGIFAFSGLVSETYHLINKMIAAEHDLPTKILEYVEHIFLFLLPLFIVFSFMSYYRLTMEIKLTGGNAKNINHEGAMKSLNNSKFILLSSLLSFTIIKIIQIIFISETTVPLREYIAYGVFLSILILFILLQHRHTNLKDEPVK